MSRGYPSAVFCFFGSVGSLILTFSLYLSLRVCHLPKRHMMSVHLCVSQASQFIIVSKKTGLNSCPEGVIAQIWDGRCHVNYERERRPDG